MALKACRECGTAISSRARVCPHCGLKRPHDLAIQHGLNRAAGVCFKAGLALTLLAILVVAAVILVADAADPVKQSKSGICHCPGGQYYDGVSNFTAYDSLEECLAADGREPKRGQGKCPTRVSAAPAIAAGELVGHPRVVDGDTIDIGDERVRLQGIDTPESRQKCRDGDGETYRCGDVATDALRALIGDGQVRCAVEDTRGRYGRLIGVCFNEAGTDVNGWLVRHGHGLAYRKYSERYVAEEEAARAEGLGMHAGAFIPPWDWRRGERLP